MRCWMVGARPATLYIWAGPSIISFRNRTGLDQDHYITHNNHLVPSFCFVRKHSRHAQHWRIFWIPPILLRQRGRNTKTRPHNVIYFSIEMRRRMRMWTTNVAAHWQDSKWARKTNKSYPKNSRALKMEPPTERGYDRDAKARQLQICLLSRQFFAGQQSEWSIMRIESTVRQVKRELVLDILGQMPADDLVVTTPPQKKDIKFILLVRVR